MRKKTEPPVNFAAKLSEAEWLFRGSLASSMLFFTMSLQKYIAIFSKT
jgi:hypothetical protein